MPLWKSTDQSASAPKYQILASNSANGSTLYGNNTVGAFIPGMAVGVFGVDQSGENSNVVSSGWVLAYQYSGPVINVVINSGGTAYANTDTIKVSGGTTNAAANVVTNGSGVITAVNFTNFGNGFINTTVANLTITTSTGSTANITPVLGGQAGRIRYENLVAMKISANSDSTLP